MESWLFEKAPRWILLVKHKLFWIVKNFCETWWQLILAKKKCLSSFPTVESRQSPESSSGRVKERTGYRRGLGTSSSKSVRISNLGWRWMHGFQTQNHACLYFFIFQVLTLNFQLNFLHACTSCILEIENAVLTKPGKYYLWSFTLHMKAR